MIWHLNSLVWLLLMAATCLSWWLAEGNIANQIVLTAIVIVTVVKVRCVFQYFMEVRHMPRPYRIAFEAWTAVVALFLAAGFVI